MKKLGFTLAEILITLGIIGVVASLTAPALIQEAGNAKIGPTLSKTVASIAVANENLLHENEIATLRRLGDATEDTGDIAQYTQLLAQHLSGATVINADYSEMEITDFLGNTPQDATRSGNGYNGNQNNRISTILLPNGVTVTFDKAATLPGNVHYNHNIDDRGSFIGYHSGVMVDINGPNTKPNRYGQDIFLFALDNSGSVIPYGSEQFRWLTTEGDNTEENVWSGADAYACNASAVGNSSGMAGIGCAGSIFDNSLKVIYK